ncbi:MAG: hypothetical protein ABJP02_17490 [Parasphingorhabdus sp.]|uniref:DUF7282 domain-containing protein n=1 Tax=Parasphingorhabdus sp. TaxID=2709688 RepID=UPI003299D6AC
MSQKSQITMGNGAANAIQVEGLTRQNEKSIVSEVRVDGMSVSTLRANTTTINFPEVTIEKAGWLVLHPVIDGRPDGDIVSGFSYLNPGQTKNVTMKIQHPADAGDKFLVMLHSDVDQDRVFDFVFVEDGINVEDTAVFEDTRMIAHVIALPE